MVIQIASLLFIGSVFSIFLPHFSYLGSAGHKVCMAYAPNSGYQAFYQAIVCGHKIRSNSDLELLKQLGVVHIIVVSGAHLLFLSRLLKFIGVFRISGTLHILILFLFVCICQFQLPALRAWVQILINKGNGRIKLFNSPSFNILLSVVFCLSLDPQSFHSLSLIMSWLASLALRLGSNVFSQSVYCYLFLSPLLMQFKIPHPWTIAVNAFLTPLLCFFLFPLSLMSFIIEPTTRVSDWAWLALFNIGDFFSAYMPPLAVAPTQWPILSLWMLPLLLNLIMLHTERATK